MNPVGYQYFHKIFPFSKLHARIRWVPNGLGSFAVHPGVTSPSIFRAPLAATMIRDSAESNGLIYARQIKFE